MARIGVVLKPFPYAADGITVEPLSKGDERSFPDPIFDGLEATGYVEAGKKDKVPDGGRGSDLDARFLAAFDTRLAAASDEELKTIIARSGTPYTGNLIHAEMVAAAKLQLVREAEGAEPVTGVDPNSGVTEQPLSAPGAPTPPSAPAAVKAAVEQESDDQSGKAAAGAKPTKKKD